MNRFLNTVTTMALLLVVTVSYSLPEDAMQDILIEAASSEFMLDEGVEVHLGSESEPARISQGSMVISGTEIRVERSGNALIRVTATGTPARSRQQPQQDQAVVYMNAATLVFDNATRIFSADGNVELMQAEDTITGNHIDYYLDTGRARGDQIQMTIKQAED